MLHRTLFRGIFAAVASCSLASAMAAGSGPSGSPVQYGTPLVCTASSSAVSVYEVARNLDQAPPSNELGAWITKAMKTSGFAAGLPNSKSARDDALALAKMLHSGNIVAAKMGNDEATRKYAKTASAVFFAKFESFLTASTQPLMHPAPSADKAVDADAKKDFDLNSANDSLVEIIRRAGIASRAMGTYFDMPSVRYYLLANGFRDDIAYVTARGAVCELDLSPEVLKKLDVSARFMAMPYAKSPQDPK